MEITTAAFLIAALGASCLAFGIYRASRSTDKDRATKHAEFNASLELTHRERMASIGAHRDEEIAKATGKPPVQTLDNPPQQRLG